MSRYPDPIRARRQLDRHGRTPAAIPLEEMSTTDLVHVATGCFGGPSPEHVAEAARRIREATPLGRFALSLTFASGGLLPGRKGTTQAVTAPGS